MVDGFFYIVSYPEIVASTYISKEEAIRLSAGRMTTRPVHVDIHAVLFQWLLFTAGNGGLASPQRDKLGPVEIL